MNDHDDAHVVGSAGVDRRPLRCEDLTVRFEQVSAFHAGTTRARADQQRDVGSIERGGDVIRHLNRVQQPERAVLQLQRRARGGSHPAGDLEHSQPDRHVGTEELARCNAKEKRVADLAARSGQSNGHGGGSRLWR